jgi:UrcA family protein
MKTIAIMTACIAAGLASAGASAQTADERVTVAVSIADLNLGEAAGRATLTRRIRAAAYRICRDPFGWDPIRLQAVSLCMVEARRSAEAQVATAIARARPRATLTDLAVR